MAKIVHIVLLLLAGVTADGVVLAQHDLSGKRLAKSYAQEGRSWGWSNEFIEYEYKGLPDRPDKIVMLRGKDTLLRVWHFQPAHWMTKHCQTPIALTEIDVENGHWRYFDARHIEYRLKPGEPQTVIQEEFNQSPLGTIYRERVRYSTYDRKTGNVAQSIDTTFNERGDPVEATIITNVEEFDEHGDRYWSTIKLRLEWKGIGSWMVTRSKSVEEVVLRKDHQGEEYLEETEQHWTLPAEVIKWPEGYRKTALEIGSRNLFLDSVLTSKSKIQYTKLTWKKISPGYSGLSRFDRFRLRDNIIASAVIVDSVGKTKPRFDTTAYQFDSEGRITERQSYEYTHRYEYSDQGQLVRIDSWLNDRPDEAKWSNHIRSMDSSVLVSTISEVKYDKADTNHFRYVNDYSFPAYDELVMNIDSTAKLKMDLKTRTFTAAQTERWSQSLQLVLMDLAGKEIASTSRASPAIRVKLGPPDSVYILRYVLNGKPVYDKTIVADM